MCDDDITAIVLDIDSDKCKAGFAGDDQPREVFPTIVEGSRRRSVLVSMKRKYTSSVGEVLLKSPR